MSMLNAATLQACMTAVVEPVTVVMALQEPAKVQGESVSAGESVIEGERWLAKSFIPNCL